MKRKTKNAPVTQDPKGRVKMRKQKSLETKEIEVSGGHLRDQLAYMLYSIGKVSNSKRIASITLEINGPLIEDKIYKLKVITREEVETYTG